MAAARWLMDFAFRRGWSAAAVRNLGLLLVVLAFLYYLPDRKQSFTVSATTEHLVVDMVTDSAPDWEVRGLEACVPTPNPSPKSVAVGNCQATRFEGRKLEDATLRWSDGYTLTFRAFEPERVEILVEKEKDAAPVYLDGDLLVETGTILRIPYRFEGERMLLPIRGYASIGDVPNTSGTLVLREGRYESRQNLGVLRRKPHVVAQGELFPGDRISFGRRAPPLFLRWAVEDVPETGPGVENVTAKMFLTDLSPAHAAFDVVATTEHSYSALKLTRVGGQPTDIPVEWTQRLQADALPVAIATMLGLLATIIALSNAFFNTGSRPGRSQLDVDQTGK